MTLRFKSIPAALAAALLLLAPSGTFADRNDVRDLGRAWAKTEKEWRKQQKELEKDIEKDRREARREREKERREAARESGKERRDAEREWTKERRELERAARKYSRY